jgi:putative oxidoreductase
MLLCEGGRISCSDLLSLEGATRYELRVKKLWGNIMTEALAAWKPRALSVLRIIAGLLIIEHGMAKYFGFPVVPSLAKVQALSLPGVGGLFELICGALLVLGLFTQPAAFLLAGEMAVAYFLLHLPRSFYPLLNGGTLAIMYCFAFLYLSAAGGGPWSIDAAIKRSQGSAIDKFNAMLARIEPQVLSLFRFVTGLLFFQYGVTKLLKFPTVPGLSDVQVLSLFGIAGMFELIFGGLLMLGLLSRLAAFILCGEMAFAYFIEHFPKNFIPILNGGSIVIMFCFSCLYFVCAGGGPWSLDALMRKKD